MRVFVAGGSGVLGRQVPPLMQMRRAAAWRETGRLRNQGARALAEACVAEGVQVLIHKSVSFVYAGGGEAWLDEDAPVDDGGAMPLRDALTGEANARSVTAAGGGAPPPWRLPAMLGPVVMGETWKYLPRSQRISSQRLHDATRWAPSVPDARAGWRLIAAQWAE
jgi:hypothetical protein